MSGNSFVYPKDIWLLIKENKEKLKSSEMLKVDFLRGILDSGIGVRELKGNGFLFTFI